jgi:hypothetical protein
VLTASAPTAATTLKECTATRGSEPASVAVISGVESSHPLRSHRCWTRSSSESSPRCDIASVMR